MTLTSTNAVTVGGALRWVTRDIDRSASLRGAPCAERRIVAHRENREMIEKRAPDAANASAWNSTTEMLAQAFVYGPRKPESRPTPNRRPPRPARRISNGTRDAATSLGLPRRCARIDRRRNIQRGVTISVTCAV